MPFNSLCACVEATYSFRASARQGRVLQSRKLCCKHTMPQIQKRLQDTSLLTAPMLNVGDGGLSAAALPVPSSFQCPITQEIMQHPVFTVDGQVYERSAIEQWFRRGNRTSPMTGTTLTSLQLTLDLPLKRAIEEYMTQRPEMERRVLNELSLEEAARVLESELHEKSLLHQTTNHQRQIGNLIAKRLAAQLREAGSSFTEAELRRTVLEVAGELDTISSDCTAQQKPAASSSSQCHEPPSRCIMDFIGHTGYVRCIAGLDAEHFVSGSYDKTAKIWSITEGCCLQTLEGNWLMKGHADKITSITRIESTLPRLMFATGSKDNTVKVWEWGGSCNPGICLLTLEGHGSFVTALASLNERVILSGAADNSVKIWNLATGKCQASMLGDETRSNIVQSLATFGSNYVAVGSSSKHINIWDVTTGQPLAVLKGHQGTVCGVVALAPGMLASCSTDMTVRLWDIGSGKSTAVLEGHKDDVNCIAAFGSGSILSGSSDETVKIWDIRTFGVLSTLQGHTDSVYGVAAVGVDRVASCSDDKQVKMWGT